MESSFRKLLARRKSVARVEPSTDSFKATNEYASLPSGVEPQIGQFSLKPSDNNNNNHQDLGHNRRKSFGAQSVSKLTNLGQSVHKSRSKSISSAHSNRKDVAANGSRSNSLTAGVTSPTFSNVPPVPKIPSLLYDSSIGKGKTTRYVDLLHAVGAHEGRPVTAVTDPYSADVAERNSAQNIELHYAAKRRSLMKYAEDVADRNSAQNVELHYAANRRSPMKYAEDVADRNINSPSSQRQSYESMRASRIGLHGASPIPPTPVSPMVQEASDQTRRPSGIDPPRAGNFQQPGAPRFASAVSPVSSQGNRSPTRSFSKVQTSEASAANHSTHSLSSVRSYQGQTVKANPVQSATGIENRVPVWSQQPEVNSTLEFHRRFPANHRRAQSSVTSVDSLPPSTLSGRGHRRGMDSEMGSGVSSNVSELDDLDDEIAGAVPGKADPVQILRTSMVGADGYIYKSGHSPVIGITEYTIEKPGTYPSNFHAPEEEPVSAINRRAAEALQKQQMAALTPVARRETRDRSTESKARISSGRKAPPPMLDFDLQGEFKKLKSRNEEVNVPVPESHPAPKRPNDTIAERQRREVEAPPPGSRSGLSNQNRGSAGQHVGVEPVVRDFATYHTPLHSPSSYSVAAHHDEDVDSAASPTIMRHRDDASVRSSRNSHRQSDDLSQPGRSGRSRNRSPSKHVTHKGSFSHSLRATIDDETEATAPDQGYSVEAIEQKRTRSLTLEASARAPLEYQTHSDDNIHSDFDRLKERLASFKAALPARRSRGNSMGLNVTGSTTSPTRTRFSHGGRTQHQPPLRQYQHLSSSSIDDDDATSDYDDNIDSTRSSFDPLGRESRLGEARKTADNVVRSSSYRRNNTAIPAMRPVSPNGYLPNPMNPVDRIRYSRTNSNRSTLSASSTASSIPYDQVPRRLSSRRKYAHHKNGLEGDYFGSNAVESESNRGSLNGRIVDGNLDIMSDILSNVSTPYSEDSKGKKTKKQRGPLTQGARSYSTTRTM